MENYYNIDKRDFSPPPVPSCPECGSKDVEIEPEEKGEHGFTLHPEQGICYNCENTWSI